MGGWGRNTSTHHPGLPPPRSRARGRQRQQRPSAGHTGATQLARCGGWESGNAFMWQLLLPLGCAHCTPPPTPTSRPATRGTRIKKVENPCHNRMQTFYCSEASFCLDLCIRPRTPRPCFQKGGSNLPQNKACPESTDIECVSACWHLCAG